MTAERWELVRRLLYSTLERPREERSPFLDEACGEDRDLRREVEALVRSHEDAGAFLEAPAWPPPMRPPEEAAPSLSPGTRLGPYEILEAIGSGGMGEVYRARDVRLRREVAVKALPAEMAADPDRRRRFELEARAASALNHPNILAVYDAGLHEGVPYIVTELLEGTTLAARVAQGPLPVRKALECGVQVARGLAAAHERGVIHRDLKPANLLLTSQGQVKILDFGLAKLEPAIPGAGRPRADGPPATNPGLVLGTVGYMSPEQVRGEAADARSDQFSLGCVLYELLAGKAPFSRPTGAQTMAAVLEAEPPSLAEVNAGVPRPVAWIVERCLAKDQHDRYGATGDLARDLELALGRLSELSLPATPARRRRHGVSKRGALLLTALIGVAGAASWWARREPPTVPAVRYLTYSGRDSSPAAAPDGRTVAFSSGRDGRRRVWLKQLATGSEAPLTAGDDDHPRFSPDGAEVLFARSERGRVSLYRVPSVGGEPRKVVDDALYGDFSPDGRRIAFVRQRAVASGMSSVVAIAGADGSGPRELATLAMGAFVHPRWSPDGQNIALTESPLQGGEATVVAIVDAKNGQVLSLPRPGDRNVWPGGLAWTGTRALLVSQPESAAGAQTGTGSRIVALDISSREARTLFSSPANTLVFDVLGRGRLVLAARSLRQNLRQVELRAKSGRRERWLTRGNGTDRQPVESPDGEWIVFSSNRTGNLDVWALHGRSGALRRLTDDAADDFDPAFAPDGRLVWSSNRSGNFEVWIANADGAAARPVTRDGVDAENPAPTPDGRFIVYASGNPRSRGIMKIPTEGGEATLLAGGNLILPEVSPDGRHVAFVADQGSEQAALRVLRLDDGAPTGFEVPLPPWIPGGSMDQGRCRWFPDGRAIAYVGRAAEGGYAVYVREFTAGAKGPGRRLAGLEPDLDAESFAIAADGASLIVSYREELDDLMLAENLAGVKRPRLGP